MESWDISDLIYPYPGVLLNDDNDEELEKIRREQDEKEWMALCQIAGKCILMYYK